MDEHDEEVDWEENGEDVAAEVTSSPIANEGNERESGRKRRLRRFSKEDREAALQLHKAELLVCLLRAAKVNDWIQDELVQAAVMSVTPLFLLHSSRNSQEEHVRDIIAWFRTSFSVVSNCSVTAEEGRDGSAPEELLMAIAKRGGSVHQLNQLFVALLRLCGFKTRYVCTLDPKGKHPRNFPELKPQEDADQEMRVSIKHSSETIVSTWAEVFIDCSRSSVHSAPSSSQAQARSSRSKAEHPELVDLVDEEESSPSCRWVHVDFNKALIDEPLGVEQRRKRAVTYVCGIDDAGQVADVTARYANQYSLSLRDRLPADDPFLIKLMRHWTAIRAFRLHSVELIENSDLALGHSKPLNGTSSSFEEEELSRRVAEEPIPTTISAFQNHTLYVLERHLKKDEVLHPELKRVVGVVKGENVYLREHVCPLKSKMQWRKDFRRVMDGQMPYRQLERKRDDGVTALGLFGEWQTEVFKVPEVVEGVLPVNKYGNIEVWDGDERFVPRGAALLRESFAGQCARQLGIPHAPAGAYN